MTENKIKKRPPYPGLHAYTDRAGHMRRYLRRKGRQSIPLSGEPGTEEFNRSYLDALAKMNTKKEPAQGFEVGLVAGSTGDATTIPEGEWVYFVRSGDFIKIGYTRHAISRMRGLSTASPLPLELLLLIPGNETTERYFHGRFRTARARGEWFFAVPTLMSFIEKRRTSKEQKMATRSQ